MANPKPLTAMLKWMMENGFNDIELAEKLTAHTKRAISPRQVFRWKRGLSYPRPAYALALEDISEGRINAKTFAADFQGDPPDKEEPPGGG